MTALTVAWGGRVTPLARLPSLARAACPLVSCGSPRLPRALASERDAEAVAEVAAGHVSSDSRAPLQQQHGELDAEFCSMLERLTAWKDRYYDCIVPRKVWAEFCWLPPLAAAACS